MVLENRLIIAVSSFASALMILCMWFISVFPGLHITALALSETGGQTAGQSVLAMLKDESQLLSIGDAEDVQRGHQLRLEIPSTVRLSDITIENDYMKRSIAITIPGIGSTYFYDYPMIGKSEGIADLLYYVSDTGGTIEMNMDGIYECISDIEGRYMYIDFARAHDIYDYVVAIDAGHGGKDVGANVGEIYEKDLNLAIMEKLKTLFDADEENIGVYYTRLEDNEVSLTDRVTLANEIKADAFVSIHVNSTDSGRESGIHGTSVLYLSVDKTGSSKELAQNCLDGMLYNMGSTSKGLIAGDDIKIIRLSEVPAALCEVGFITNPEERELICSAEYQEKIAAGIYQGIKKTLSDSAVTEQTNAQ